MDLTIEVQARRAADELRSLRAWMVAEDALRGRVRLVAAAPGPGTLGSVVETLAVTLGPGGVATALASVLITWIRQRTGNVKFRISKPDGTSCEFSATYVSGLSASEVQKMIAALSRCIEEETLDPS